MTNTLQEVAARYGVDIHPDAVVQYIPRGVSGEEILPDGKGLSWKDGAKKTQSSYFRNLRFEKAERLRKAADAEQERLARPDIIKPVSTFDPVAAGRGTKMIADAQARHVERIATVTRMCGENATLADIMAATGYLDIDNLKALIRKVAPGYVIKRKARATVVNAEHVRIATRLQPMIGMATGAAMAAAIGLTVKQLQNTITRLEKKGLLVLPKGVVRMPSRIAVRDQTIARMWGEGMPIEGIASAVGAKEEAVRISMKRQGITPPPFKRPVRIRDDLNADIAALQAKGWSSHAIAKKLGVVRKTVVRRMVKA